MQVFISHAKEDNNTVRQIMTLLDNKRIQHWEDITHIKPGDSVNEKINQGIKSSSHFLLVWSKNADNSNNVKKECNAVMTPDYEKITKIIFRTDGTKLPPLLADIKYININDDELEDIIEQIKQEQIKDPIYEKFDAYLDEEFGDISVADHKYTTSFALSRIDYVAYREYMINWEDESNEERN